MRGFLFLVLISFSSLSLSAQGVSMSINGISCQGTVIGDGLVLTARHCWTGVVVGTDAVVMRLAEFSGPTPKFAKMAAGPAHCFVVRQGARVRVDFMLDDVGYVGYWRSSWAPISGDSGSAVYQGDSIVGVVSWRSTWRPYVGGISTLDINAILAILDSLGAIIDEVPDPPFIDPPVLNPRQLRILQNVFSILRRLL